MKTLTARERWLLAVLAPIVLFALYVAGWRDAYVAERIVAREGRLGQLRAAAGDGIGRDLAERQGDVDALADRKDALDARAERLQEEWTVPAARAATVRRVAQVLQEHGVRLVESASHEDAQERPALAPGLVELARGMNAAGGAEPELWRFALEGRFGDLHDALADLESLRDVFALPVTIALDRTTGGDALDVTLWIWI